MSKEWPIAVGDLWHEEVQKRIEALEETHVHNYSMDGDNSWTTSPQMPDGPPQEPSGVCRYELAAEQTNSEHVTCPPCKPPQPEKPDEGEDVKSIVLPKIDEGFRWEIIGRDVVAVESEPVRFPESGPEESLFYTVPDSEEVLRLRAESRGHMFTPDEPDTDGYLLSKKVKEIERLKSEVAEFITVVGAQHEEIEQLKVKVKNVTCQLEEEIEEESWRDNNTNGYKRCLAILKSE